MGGDEDREAYKAVVWRRGAWREGSVVGGRADCGTWSGLSTGRSMSRTANGSKVLATPTTSPAITSDLRQEPGAGNPHAGICAGGGEQSPSLPRPVTGSRI